MKSKSFAWMIVLVLIAFGAIAGDVPQTLQVAQPGTFSFADGSGAFSLKQHLGCGPASPYGRVYPGSGPAGPMTIDLSFGVLPAGDRLGDTERYLGSWSVRSTAGPLYDGGVTRGTISPIKGGGSVYELYGFTNFTGTSCNGLVSAPAEYDTRNPVRIFGACGSGQEITFEISRRPLVTDKSGFTSFPESDVIVRGTFRGSVTCGQTTDRSRVRTNLTSRR